MRAVLWVQGLQPASSQLQQQQATASLLSLLKPDELSWTALMHSAATGAAFPMSLAPFTAAASQAPPASMPQHDAAHAPPAVSAPQQQLRGPQAAAMVSSTSMGLNVVHFSAAGQHDLLMQPGTGQRQPMSSAAAAEQLPAASAELGHPGSRRDLGQWPVAQPAGPLHALSGLALDKNLDTAPHVAA
jgi:hypothetical protein